MNAHTNTHTNAHTDEQLPKHKRYLYKRISVRRPDTGLATTISMSPREWKQALGYVNGSELRVTEAVRHVAQRLDLTDVMRGDFSLMVRRKALARLRGSVRSPAARLAAENNAAWSG